MRIIVTAGLALYASLAVAAPMELPEPVRAVLSAARAAQKDSRNDEAIELGRAGMVRFAADPTVQPWHLASLLRTMAEAYEQAGVKELAARAMSAASLAMRQAPDKHDDLRRWIAAEAAQKLRRVGSLALAREQMDFAVRDIVSFVDHAEKGAREIAIETLLDDVELSLEENDLQVANVTLALVRHLMIAHDISDPDLLLRLQELLEHAAGADSSDGS